MVLDAPTFPNADVNLAAQLDTMVSTGVESLRVSFDWRVTQPYESWSDVPADQRDQFTDVDGLPLRLGSLDQLVGLAAQRGLSIAPTVSDAPDWDAIAVNYFQFTQTPRTYAPYAKFLRALIDRYGPHGSFWTSHAPKRAIRTWQVWNEPDIAVFWTPQPHFASSYVRLLKVAHDAIKAGDPGAKVVLGSLTNYSWTHLHQIYSVRGARRLFDIAAVHPYTLHPSGVLTILQRFRQTMNAGGDRRKQFVVDEFGWPASQGKTPQHFGFETTQRGQASNIGWIVPRLGANRGKLGIGGFDLYNWAGEEIPKGYEFTFAGLFHYTGGRFVANPSYGVFRRAALALERCRRKGAVATVCAKSR